MNNRGENCKVCGCTNKARCRGLCNQHYADTYIHREQHGGKIYNLRNLVIEGKR